MERPLLPILLILVLLFLVVFINTDLTGYAVKKSYLSCEDSDIGENSIFIKGIVSGNYDYVLENNEYVFEDGCIDKVFLKEYYCYGTNPEYVEYRCENGCSNGICLE
jgi:hypothetical protein